MISEHEPTHRNPTVEEMSPEEAAHVWIEGHLKEVIFPRAEDVYLRAEAEGFSRDLVELVVYQYPPFKSTTFEGREHWFLVEQFLRDEVPYPLGRREV